MAGWFGHTQTLTSISKSVTTVASGILGLEANLATFMQKVTYYEQYFERMAPNLPVEVITTASRLFARCYEYRAEIRDELESSLAYVADAGRWVVGMEDWNSKMEKRLGQISELVLLANTLLIEFAVTGAWGAQGSKDALDGYLRQFAESVVLRNPTESKKETRLAVKTTTKTEEHFENPLFPPATNVSTDSSSTSGLDAPVVVPETNYNPLFPAPPAIVTPNEVSPMTSDNEELFLARSGVDSGMADGENDGPTNGHLRVEISADEDDDVLNPFARAYQPPVSIGSSLASLRAESDNGSVYYNAMDSQVMSSGGDRQDDSADEPDSPVSLGEYECLEMDSIPQYVAFKPTALSRKRRLKQQFFGGPNNSTSPSASIVSIASAPASLNPTPKGSPRPTSATKRMVDPTKDRQRLMDLTYSYDFQRELTFNPFASPGMSSIPVPSTGAQPPALDVSARHRVPSTVHEEDSTFEVKEQVFGRIQDVQSIGPERDATNIEGLPAKTSEETREVVESNPVRIDQVQDEEPAHKSQEKRLTNHEDQEVSAESVTCTPVTHDLVDLPNLSDVDDIDLASSIGEEELSAVFYSAPEEFSRVLRDEDEERVKKQVQSS